MSICDPYRNLWGISTSSDRLHYIGPRVITIVWQAVALSNEDKLILVLCSGFILLVPGKVGDIPDLVVDLV